VIVTIHQPEHLIWLGLIDKISQADVFVILDNVQFEKNNVQNRNKVRTKEGWTWLTVPLKKHPYDTLIKDVEIASDSDWQTRNLNLIKNNYRKAPFFNDYYSQVEEIVRNGQRYLAELNIELIRFVLTSFSVKTKVVIASEAGYYGPKFKENANLEICKTLKTDVYISGAGGKNYLDTSLFDAVGTKVVFQKFQHPVYVQQFEPFLSCMSSIDLLFNCGLQSREILFGSKAINDPNHMENTQNFITQS
jgi:hypothetical protein